MNESASKPNHLARLREAVVNNPDSPEAQMRLGSALVHTASLNEAEQALRRAVELEPNYAEAWINLGGVLMTRHDFEGCVEANQKAAACRPDLALAHYNQGLGHMFLGQSEEMLDCFRRVVELEADNPGGNYYLAVALFAVGQVAQAKPVLNKALALGWAPQPEFIRAISRERGGCAPTLELGAKEQDQSQDPSSKEE